MTSSSRKRHVVHVVNGFSTGGLENIVVQIINSLPTSQFEHTVLALTRVDVDFAKRIEVANVEFLQLDKPPGHPYGLFPKVFRLLRSLKPDVVHTCNLAALEFMPIAYIARVPLRVHVEHGWDIGDLHGSNLRYRSIRRWLLRFATSAVGVSPQIFRYLTSTVGVPARKARLIFNGVDVEKFAPKEGYAQGPEYQPALGGSWIIGAVGRLEPVKNHALLIKAFANVVDRADPNRSRFLLWIIGEGSQRRMLEDLAARLQVADRVWFAGNRADVPDLMKRMHCFVLPSLAEGTSCTLQEAMATALPVIATDVGGSRELLADGACGLLVPSNDEQSMATAILHAFAEPNAAAKRARLARAVAVESYSVTGMVSQYSSLFSGGFDG